MRQWEDGGGRAESSVGWGLGKDCYPLSCRKSVGMTKVVLSAPSTSVNKCQSVLFDALRFSHLRVSKPPLLVKTVRPYLPESDRIGLGFVIYQAVHRQGFLFIVDWPTWPLREVLMTKGVLPVSGTKSAQTFPTLNRHTLHSGCQGTTSCFWHPVASKQWPLLTPWLHRAPWDWRIM